MAGRYPYLGHQEMWYQDYRDDATGRMLVASPEESYDMTPVGPGYTVPPNDGRWEDPDAADSGPADPEPVWSAPAQPAPAQDNAPAPAQDEPEGGEN